MVTANARFARVRGGKLFFAEVVVEFEPSSRTPGVELRCCGRGFSGQGYVEDVPAVGYDDWKNGARAGAAFALAVAAARSARVAVTRICGLTTDTNPSVVGAATASAVWQALEFEPPADIVAQIERVVFSSWQRPPDDVPQFAEPDTASDPS